MGTWTITVSKLAGNSTISFCTGSNQYLLQSITNPGQNSSVSYSPSAASTCNYLNQNITLMVSGPFNSDDSVLVQWNETALASQTLNVGENLLTFNSSFLKRRFFGLFYDELVFI
jgi:hypothetical protein